jgi:hypothetical protein
MVTGSTHHTQQRQEQRNFTDQELADIVGNDHWTPAWRTGYVATPGQPVCIGVQPAEPGGDRRQVLLGVTREGRFGVAVIARKSNGHGVMVTVWDPAASPDLWREDFTGPSAAGVRALPPTAWYRHRPHTREAGTGSSEAENR